MKLDKDGHCIEAYGFKIGDVVEAKTSIQDERKAIVEAGDKLRLVAFAPKVFVATKAYRNNETVDGKAFLFNAVRDGERDIQDPFDGLPSSPRIRANFCTIKKIKE